MGEVAKVSVPTELPAAVAAIRKAEAVVDKIKTYDELLKFERWVNAIRVYWTHVEEIRQRSERVLVIAAWHAGGKAIEAGEARGGDRKSKNQKSSPGSFDKPTLQQMFGSKKRGSRFKRLRKSLPERDELDRMLAAIHGDAKEATVSAVLRSIADELRATRREQSRSAKPIVDGMDLRVGDSRQKLADIPDNSVPLILTDPPYEEAAEPLYVWLAEFAERVLIPGGSLICFTGHWSLNRDMRIFDERLRYWWLLVLLHRQSKRLPGKFVMANFKPVLWYVKDFRRGKTLIPDVLKDSKREKDAHNWGQGEAGVGKLIEDLTDPGEVIVDPFAGTADWGRLATAMGRRWIGCDVVEGGQELVVA